MLSFVVNIGDGWVTSTYLTNVPEFTIKKEACGSQCHFSEGISTDIGHFEMILVEVQEITCNQ